MRNDNLMRNGNKYIKTYAFTFEIEKTMWIQLQNHQLHIMHHTYYYILFSIPSYVRWITKTSTSGTVGMFILNDMPN